jgi:hypothetical protein
MFLVKSITNNLVKKVVRALLLTTILCFSFASHADSDFNVLFGGDHGGSHPWPWGHEVPFPWDDVQGIWQVQKAGKPVFFSFRRLESKRLAVNQFDLDACQVIAGGPGLEFDKTVVTQMNEFGTLNVYRITLYAFNPKDAPEAPVNRNGYGPGQILVARITNLRAPGPELAFQIVKISDSLEVRCARQNKFLRF